METIDTILEYWFGANPDDAVVAAERAKLWWAKSPEVDEDIRRRYESYVLKAGGGDLPDWQSTPRGRLALILLTDQFPRNIYRDSAKAFAFDPKALALCLDGIAVGFDLKLRPIERTFFYLPLEHAESLELQDKCVELFGALANSVPAKWKTPFTEYLDFAIRHREAIRRFGRFPHRNKLLGRDSTPEELAFLQQPESSF